MIIAQWLCSCWPLFSSPLFFFWVVFYFLMVLCVPGCWMLFRQRCKSISVGLYTENRNARNLKERKSKNFLASSSGEKGRYVWRNNPPPSSNSRTSHSRRCIMDLYTYTYRSLSRIEPAGRKNVLKRKTKNSSWISIFSFPLSNKERLSVSLYFLLYQWRHSVRFGQEDRRSKSKDIEKDTFDGILFFLLVWRHIFLVCELKSSQSFPIWKKQK